MADTLPPLELIKKLKQNAGALEDAEAKKYMLEAAGTIKYLVTLLKECASYIEDFKEYDIPPRFLKAVKEVLPE